MSTISIRTRTREHLNKPRIRSRKGPLTDVTLTPTLSRRGRGAWTPAFAGETVKGAGLIQSISSPSNDVESWQWQHSQSVMDMDSFQPGIHLTNTGLANLALRQAQEECTLSVELLGLSLWERKLGRPIQVYEIPSNGVWLEPTTLYEDEPNTLPSVFNIHHDLWGSVHDLIPHELHASPIGSPPSSQTGDVPLPITSGEQPSWPPVLSSTMWPETGARAYWSGWRGAGEAFAERTEPTIGLLLERLSHRHFSVVGETKDASTNHVLATLQATNPEAVEKIRKLRDLEPDWDGYGGIPPTEEAVKATAGLLLETYKLTQGQLENPFIAPLPEGGLELEWELDSSVELMLVIPPTGTDIEYLLEELKGSGDVNESEGIVPKDATLSELINRLTQ